MDLMRATSVAIADLSYARKSMEKMDRVLRGWLKSHELSRRVLIVDDDLMMCQTLVNIIQTHLSVVSDYALNTSDALELWEEHRHGVIVSDVMNGDDGDTFHFLTEIGRGPRVAILTGRELTKDLKNAARTVDAMLVQKGEDTIVSIVRKLLNAAAPM